MIIFAIPEGKWVGFDLDGTLAHYDGFRGPDHIGEPIAPMVNLAGEYIKNGVEVRIVTARANPRNYPGQHKIFMDTCRKWAVDIFGIDLVITCRKDQDMHLLYDDRAIGVEKNTGRILQRMRFDSMEPRRGISVEDVDIAFVRGISEENADTGFDQISSNQIDLQLSDRLVKLAGLSDDDVINGKVRENLRTVLHAFLRINKGKNRQYGDYVKNMSTGPRLLQRIQLYCELKRKWFRFENMIFRMTSEDPVKAEELMEVLADIGVYAAMGIDLVVSQDDEKK